jgi:hypothetical protein
MQPGAYDQLFSSEELKRYMGLYMKWRPVEPPSVVPLAELGQPITRIEQRFVGFLQLLLYPVYLPPKASSAVPISLGPVRVDSGAGSSSGSSSSFSSSARVAISPVVPGFAELHGLSPSSLIGHVPESVAVPAAQSMGEIIKNCLKKHEVFIRLITGIVQAPEVDYQIKLQLRYLVHDVVYLFAQYSSLVTHDDPFPADVLQVLQVQIS